METIKLSEVGGLNSALLARMNGGILVLTSNQVARVAVMPYGVYEITARQAVESYQSIDVKSRVDDWPSTGRVRDSTLFTLHVNKILLVRKRKFYVAVLLPILVGHRDECAKLYLQTLGYE